MDYEKKTVSYYDSDGQLTGVKITETMTFEEARKRYPFLYPVSVNRTAPQSVKQERP